jgi:hypothetical protein
MQRAMGRDMAVRWGLVPATGDPCAVDQARQEGLGGGWAQSPRRGGFAVHFRHEPRGRQGFDLHRIGVQADEYLWRRTADTERRACWRG